MTAPARIVSPHLRRNISSLSRSFPGSRVHLNHAADMSGHGTPSPLINSLIQPYKLQEFECQPRVFPRTRSGHRTFVFDSKTPVEMSGRTRFRVRNVSGPCPQVSDQAPSDTKQTACSHRRSPAIMAKNLILRSNRVMTATQKGARQKGIWPRKVESSDYIKKPNI